MLVHVYLDGKLSLNFCKINGKLPFLVSIVTVSLVKVEGGGGGGVHEIAGS